MKQHWYGFRFEHKYKKRDIVLGFPFKQMGMSRVQKAKREAGLPRRAVTLEIGYIGYMTEGELIDLHGSPDSTN